MSHSVWFSTNIGIFSVVGRKTDIGSFSNADHDWRNLLFCIIPDRFVGILIEIRSL